MINRPLNISPQNLQRIRRLLFANYVQSGEENNGAARMKIPLDIFHICLYFFAIKKIRALKAIRIKRNIINEFIISSFW